MIIKKIRCFINRNSGLKNILNIINKFFADDIFGLSAELTFYLMMSFFPFVILLLALISITHLSAEDTLFKLLSALPDEAYNIVTYVLRGVERSSAIIVTSGIIAVWSVSCAVSTINKALNRMYKTKDKRNFLIIRGFGFLFAILLAVAIVLTFFLLIFGNLIGVAIMEFFPSFYVVWDILRIFIVYCVLMVIFSAIYKIIPDKKLRYSEVVWGALFATSIWGGASMLYSFYVDNFAKYHIIYGSLNGIVVLMTWLYMTSIILLSGGEINSIVHISRISKK